ncbi:MAG: hypothetical protein ACI94O_001957, partial [Octadecabacter sp.]
SGNTSVAGASLLFEMLCALPGVQRERETPMTDISF